MFTYFIKRETDIPWDQSQGILMLEGYSGRESYDIVKSHRDTGLDMVSDFIIDENNVIIKAAPDKKEEFIRLYESQYVTKLQELLLG